jgi:hypothetical protein
MGPKERGRMKERGPSQWESMDTNGPYKVHIVLRRLPCNFLMQPRLFLNLRTSTLWMETADSSEMSAR